VSEVDRAVRDRTMRETETFPVVQRGGIRFFRRVTRGFLAFFHQVGARG
jgi:hypothetical protein